MDKMNKKIDNIKNQRIQVFARCRPLNNLERKQGSPSIIEVVPEKKEIVVKERNLSREFFFDKVFPPDVKQVTVYKSVVEPLIQEVLMGYNCTVFAYGQTGTGKTYTMEGERSNAECSWEDDPGAGIIPRSLHQLFEELNKEENVEFYVRVSFLELYNEELFDLLSATELSRLRIYESSKKGSVVIQGLQELIVNTKDEVYSILEKGTARRQTAATMLNATSSRSHTIFSVTVHIKENTVDGEELLKIGKLNLVDLAGSENVGRSGAVDKRAREAGNINQSLLTLGRVITALIEKQPHVPYRESKLTRLLQDSLGGHTKTSIIATISPAQINFDETISTLDYATKAKSITIKPEVNQKMTKRALIREYQEKIDRLQKDIEATRNKEGFYIASENYTEMVNEIECNKAKIKELEDQLETLTEENKMVEDYLNKVKEELAETKHQQEETVSKLSHTKQILNNTQKVLEKTALDRDEKNCLLTAHCNTEKKLSQQAQTLLDVTDQTTNDIHKLHAKLDRKLKVEQSNEELCQNFKEMYQQQFAMLDDMVSTSKSTQIQNLRNINEDLSEFVSGLDVYRQKSVSLLKEIISGQTNELSNISLNLNENSSKQKEWMVTLSQDLDSKKAILSAEQEKFLTRTLPLLVQKQQLVFSEMEQWMQKGHNELCKKINELHDDIKKQSESKSENLKEMNNILDLFYKHHEMSLEDLEEKIQSLSSSQLKRKKIYDQECARKEKFFNEMLLSINKFIEQEKELNQVQNETDENISLQISQIKTKELRSNIAELKTIEKPLSNMESFEKESFANMTTLNEIASIVKIEEFTTKLGNAVNSQKSLSSEVTKFIQANQKLEESNLHSVKDSLENNRAFIQSNLEENTTKLKIIQNSLADKANCGELSLDEQNKNLLNKVSHTVDIINNSESNLNLVAENLRQEILQRNKELEKFISEDLQKDLPTGTTPQRKTYDYPKYLVATSPHDRILQRIRSYQNDKMNSAVNLPLDSSFDESDEFKSPSSDNVTESTLINRSFTSEDVDYYSTTDCETESNASSMSDLSVVGLRNKENTQNFPKPSNLPKLQKCKDFRKPSRPASNRRKPLISKNPPTDS